MLYFIEIHPYYRKQKVGKSIMTFIEEFGKSINTDFIFLGCDSDNQGARQFCTKLGYGEDYGFYKYI